MGDEIDAKLILETQERLGKFVRKPPLNDKLLRKPPFKFLHDIITSVINSTGFMKGIFTEEELNSENIKDREKKIIFLQKAIDYVASANNETLKIRPSKTVAGQEADKTNLFLQALARGIESSLKNGQTLDNKEEKRSSSHRRKSENAETLEKIPDQSKKLNQSTKSSSRLKTDEKLKKEKIKVNGDLKKSPDKKVHGDKTNGLKESNRGRGKASIKENNLKGSSEVNGKSKSKTKPKEAEDENNIKKSSKESIDKNLKSSSRRPSITNGVGNEEKFINPKSSPVKKNLIAMVSEESLKMEASRTKEVNEVKNENQEKEFVEPDVNRNAENAESGRSTTAKLSRSDTMTLLDSNAETKAVNYEKEEPVVNTAPTRPSTSSVRKNSARPSTARPAAPRVRVVDTTPDEIPGPQVLKPVTNIILDGEQNKDEDDNELQIEDAPTNKNDIVVSMNDLENKPHGSLVTQILETKKDLENGSNISNFAMKQESKTIISESARKKEREVLSREIEKLREGIQKVTSCAYPLGKLVGYLQEDIDIMIREIAVWTQESAKFEAELVKEKSKSDLELERRHAQLQNIDEAIETQLSEIFMTKARTLRNNEHINQLLSAGI